MEVLKEAPEVLVFDKYDIVIDEILNMVDYYCRSEEYVLKDYEVSIPAYVYLSLTENKICKFASKTYTEYCAIPDMNRMSVLHDLDDFSAMCI